MKEKIDPEQENSEDEIDFTKDIEEVCNEKTEIYNEKIGDVNGHHDKSNERMKSGDNKKDDKTKDKEQDEVELDEDYTEIIKI